MDHAEVLDHLDAAFVGPGKLWSIETDASDAGVAARAHIAGCEPCRAEHEALVATAAMLAAGAPESVRAPDGARDRLLRHVHELGVPRGAPGVGASRPAGGTAEVGAVDSVGERGSQVVVPLRRRPRTGVLAGLAVAAAVVLLVAGAAIGRLAFPGGETAAEEIRQLVATTGSIDRVLSQPDHREARLATRRLMDGGTVLISANRQWLVVVSNALAEPPAASWYACFLERDGQRTQLGWMQFAEGLAYWDGPVKGPPDIGRPGDRFVVVLQPVGDAPELTATF